MRLRPYTAVLPKPLMPIGDRPVLDIVIRQLHHFGFSGVTIATGYLAELIEAFFRDGQEYGIPIDYHREHTPLGTVGALATIDGLDAPFLVMNGDVLTDLDYRALMDDHIASGAAATIATITRDQQVSLGVLRFSDAHQPDRLTALRGEAAHALRGVDGRLRLLARGARVHRAGRAAGLPRPRARLLEAGETVRAHRPDGYWLDIGRHDDYEQAQDEFERMRHRLIPGEPHGDRRWKSDRRNGDERRDGDRRDGERRTEPERRLPVGNANGDGDVARIELPSANGSAATPRQPAE